MQQILKKATEKQDDRDLYLHLIGQFGKNYFKFVRIFYVEHTSTQIYKPDLVIREKSLT